MAWTDYDTTAANNTSISGIAVSDATRADEVDDIVRQLMADTASAIAGNIDVSFSGLTITDTAPTITITRTGTGADHEIRDPGSNGTLRISADANDEVASSTIAFFVDGTNVAELDENGGLQLDGGAYIGGTGAANYLDDFEEGTWTPAFAFGGGTTGITYGSQTGVYIKVGEFVLAEGAVTLTNNGSSTGDWTITGFPFSFSAARATCVVHPGSVAGLSNTPILLAQSAAAVADVKETTATGNSALDDTNTTNTTTVRFSIAYRTT